jgi:Domain of unknown function (DUF5916)
MSKTNLMKIYYMLSLLCLFSAFAKAQQQRKKLPAQRTNAVIKIDGNLDEAAWKNAVPAKDFIEWRPDFGRVEDPSSKTIVYILYDNNSVYIGGYCYERSGDSISKELVGRDVVGVNDFLGVIFDTYNDKINGVGFYVTPYGEQFDAKYSNANQGEDPSWNAVWNSAAKVHADGWSFEMRIPYSAFRFSNRDNQDWGLNMTRRRNKTGQQFMWNPVNPKVNGFINQEGLWTGIEKIQAPIRLSFSPYFSTYLNHYPYKTPGVKDWTSSVNGGMDVKYGISEGFTLDMTLIPDFGQVQSDNQVLNLSPFEVKYNENRSFFTEGTELFNKGDLFYSRRIGGQPLRYYDVQDTSATDDHIHSGEHFIKNPLESKLINGTKISGRTKGGLGIGFFNAITAPMYATVEDNAGVKRNIKTSPLTNYNIIVFDQTLKNNSAVSLINTNVSRQGDYYNANATAALFDLNNKKNTYKINGKLAFSELYGPSQAISVGHAHQLQFSKTGGNWQYQLLEDATDSKYDINDMGILFYNNYLDHYLYTGYKWLKPKSWYNMIQINYNAYYSLLYSKIDSQKVNSNFQVFTTNVNAYAQLKNLWNVSMFIGYVPRGNDFHEPRTTGYSFRTPTRIQFNPTVETNSAKKYYMNLSYFMAIRSLFNSPNYQVNFLQRYRFNDKFSITESINYNPTINDAGYFSQYIQNSIVQDVIFSRRDLKTVENIVSLKYNFNRKSGITFRARHYWSKVVPKQLYDLMPDGNLKPTVHTDVLITDDNINYFNIDALYTLEFAPGSFINIAWKQQGVLSNENAGYTYLKNFNQTITSPQNNNVSIKVIYYLDYIDLKKHSKKNRE